MKRIALITSLALALALGALAQPARADVNTGHISMWVTSGTTYCNAYANTVSVDSNILTFGAGTYRFRYTIVKDGANIIYSTLHQWNLAASTWYAMPAWNDYLNIPSGAGVRAYLFKKGSDGVFRVVAQETHACFTPKSTSGAGTEELDSPEEIDSAENPAESVAQ